MQPPENPGYRRVSYADKPTPAPPALPRPAPRAPRPRKTPPLGSVSVQALLAILAATNRPHHTVPQIKAAIDLITPPPAKGTDSQAT